MEYIQECEHLIRGLELWRPEDISGTQSHPDSNNELDVDIELSFIEVSHMKFPFQ